MTLLMNKKKKRFDWSDRVYLNRDDSISATPGGFHFDCCSFCRLSFLFVAPGKYVTTLEFQIPEDLPTTQTTPHG